MWRYKPGCAYDFVRCPKFNQLELECLKYIRHTPSFEIRKDPYNLICLFQANFIVHLCHFQEPPFHFLQCKVMICEFAVFKAVYAVLCTMGMISVGAPKLLHERESTALTG